MKIAVIGRGGREHALAWKLAQDAGAENVFCLPGNGGTPNNRPVQETDADGIRRFCEEEGVELVVIGPEAPLAAGVVDQLADAPFQVFGPTRKAAKLESSKAWSKAFMNRHGIPTAAGETFRSPREAADHVRSQTDGIVIKVSGLAAGKGVFVCDDPEAALIALRQIDQQYGEHTKLVVEERLEGPEVSVMGIVDGTSIQLFSTSRDHKRLLDGDHGPNTGGMGAYTPVADVDEALMEEIRRTVVDPTLKGLAEEGIPYRGFLYFGLMLTRGGPKLLEYNARMGDPETEVLLPALDGPLLPSLLACFDGTLDAHPLAIKPGVVIDVVLAAGGYPGAIRSGVPITGLEQTDALVFHAGTTRRDGELQVSGGRVLNVTAHGRDLEEARQKAYAACGQIRFEGMQFRLDIGGGGGAA